MQIGEGGYWDRFGILKNQPGERSVFGFCLIFFPKGAQRPCKGSPIPTKPLIPRYRLAQVAENLASRGIQGGIHFRMPYTFTHPSCHGRSGSKKAYPRS